MVIRMVDHKIFTKIESRHLHVHPVKISASQLAYNSQTVPKRELRWISYFSDVGILHIDLIQRSLDTPCMAGARRR